jgi:hypothetical protein
MWFNVPMELITIATDLENVFFRELLVPSCGGAGLELTVLHPQTESMLFSDKRYILTDYLTRSKRDDLIVFTDAYDALFIRGQEYIEHAYKNFAERIVFGAEVNSWPLGAVGFALHEAPPVGPYPYLNSGGLICYPQDLVDVQQKYPDPPSDQFEILKRIRAHGYNADDKYHFSDQYYWTLVQHLEPNLIGIDHNASIFECYTAPIPDLVISEVMRNERVFLEQGREAEAYKQERTRLEARLKEPSGAAQMHFAGTVTKTVLLDLLADGALPQWLCASLAPRDSFSDIVRVIEI